MTSYLRKYVTALASARDYIAHWSSEHIYADEELIIPFPTIARFNPDKHVWIVDIKAWVYLPFQTKSLTSYLPSLPSIFTGTKNAEIKADETTDSNNDNKTKKTIFNEQDQNKESPSTSNNKVEQEKKDTAAAVSEENHQIKKNDGSSNEASDSDDDMYEDALRKNSFLNGINCKFRCRRRTW
jgi:hypothetical protein